MGWIKSNMAGLIVGIVVGRWVLPVVLNKLPSLGR